MKKKDTLLYRFARPIITVLFKTFFTPKIIGKEKIPASGRIILAGNHTSNFDCLLLMSSTKRSIHFLAKKELFQGKAKSIVKGMGCISVDRKIHDKDALNLAYKTLENNKVIGIFPEGTINRTDSVIMPFKIGAVKMANKTSSYLVPFTITGKYKMFKKTIRIEFHKAYKVSSNLEKENNKLMNIISENLIRYNKEK